MKSESSKNEGALAAFAVIAIIVAVSGISTLPLKFAGMTKQYLPFTPLFPSAANNFAVICPFRAYVMRIR